MKNFLLNSLLWFFPIAIFSQSNGDSIRYTINNVGYIDVSKKLELQSANYKPQVDNRIVFQQKGLNENKPQSKDTYVRLVVKTKIGSMGDYEKLTSKIDASASEMKDIDDGLKQGVIQQIKRESIGDKLLMWYGTSIEKVNGQTCLKCYYLRQINDNPPVEVTNYIFQNNDRIHYITIEYRKNEKNIWLPVLIKSLKSFKITNVR